MQNRVALRIWTTTGRGAAKNRAFSEVISAPTDRLTRRATPAANGTVVSAISAAGICQSALAEVLMVDSFPISLVTVDALSVSLLQKLWKELSQSLQS
jgi:hypothetical protein